ncbi:6-carboxytetrahydropterin synthase [Desulfurobacterium sp.]
MFEISKSFTFSAAHSVFSQQLNPKWTKNTYPKCRRLPGHGHNYTLTVYLVSDTLDRSQMVTDFGHLSWFKKFLDRCFDHKLILSSQDTGTLMFFKKLGIFEDGKIVLPEIEKMKPSLKFYGVNESYTFVTGEIDVESVPLDNFRYLTFDNFSCPAFSENSIVEIDFYQRLLDGIAIFDESPTSENLAKFFYKFINESIKPMGIRCSKVTIKETETSSATYLE